MTKTRVIGLAVLAGGLTFGVVGGEYGTLDWWNLRQSIRSENEAIDRLTNEVDSLTSWAEALETDSATQEIKTQIEAIQQVSEETANAVTAVAEQMQDLNLVAEAIGSAVEQQTAATSEISQNVVQAAEGAQEVSAKIIDISSTLEKTGENANIVQASSQNLNDQTQQLQQAVDRFLVQMRSA